MTKKTTRLEDLAERAGVSVSTASRALNDSPAVSMRTKRAIWQLAREMDYPFRRHMPAGPIGAKATVSIVVPKPQGRGAQLSDPFFFELLAGVGDAARERDCDIHVSHVAPASFEDLHAAMTTHRADGVIFVGQSALHHAFNQLAESETQFVVWGAELPEQNYCSVGSDNLLGGERATQHLARLGRERIVFLGETEAPEAMQRYRGYRTALSRAKLAEDPDLLVPAHFSLQSAQSAIEALLARGVAFDGVIAASDVMALGALRALHRAGKRVPHDVSLVGYDNISYARYSEPALTTVDQDVANAGRLMLAKLLDGQRGAIARSERLATDLIVRESCGA
ncbi:LacI family transcriptional regulator [Marinicauda algicola]|uniref:LacI family transcriptional regulator n=1 Tax=Marinicauda algicola TaxID=2029849 RepID=A0A4S2GX00_9PROT|nr:LacI family DNA-binding transcriptional regulator [Marinicauda algicola]TGY87680.1 LacI family transcriptional regulator [Marinicauda algicola]